jgi:hypothetical protein
MTLLNGSEAKVREMADHPLTLILARLMSILGIPMIAALGWFVFANTVSNQNRIAVIEVALDQKTKDRYTSGDAAKDFALRDERISNLDNRISHLENRPH